MIVTNKRKRVSPLRMDPTRTTVLRRAFMAEVRLRLRALRGAINKLIVDEDAFGVRADRRAVIRPRGVPTVAATRTAPPPAIQNTVLTINVVRRVGGLWYVYSEKGKKLSRGYRTRAAATRRLRQIEYFKQKGTNNALTTNTRWRFETDDKKLEAYQEWLQGQVDAGILEVTGPNKDTPWLEPYIKSAYKKGLLRTYTDTHAAGIAAAGKEFEFMAGGKAAFLDMAFNSPTAQSKMRLLGTRAFTHLKGVTADMDKEMTRILTDGMARGAGARELARELNKSVTALEKKRALAIARTETIHAHAEGQLDSFERLGVDQVGVMAEWSTAHDDLVCPMCEPLEGVILTVKEARGMIPRHPNCRCAWIPANVGENIKGTTATQWAGPGQGLAIPGTKPTGKVTGQVWHRDEAQARIRASIKAEYPRLSTKAARAASRWVGADVTKVSIKLKPGSKAYKAAAAKVVARKRAAQKAAAVKVAHSLKTKFGLVKKKYGLTDDDLFQPPGKALPTLGQDTAKKLATARGVEDWGAKDFVEVTAAAVKYADPTVPALKAQMQAFEEVVEKKLAGQAVAAKKAAEEAAKIKAAEKALAAKYTDDAAEAVKNWGGGVTGGHLLDDADYTALIAKGWGTPTGGRTQSYGLIIFDSDGRVLMREPTGHYGGAHWTFAKGGGTKPATTALAELLEETGHQGIIQDVLPGGFKGAKTKTNYFLGRSFGVDLGAMDAETAGTKWMTFDEAKKAIALSADPVVVARDTEVLQAAYKHLTTSDGVLFAALKKSGAEGHNKVKAAAAKAAHAHKTKLGMAKKHYAKPKFGGGVVDMDWVNPATKQKLNVEGINKVLSEKGWHTTTLPGGTANKILMADDVVEQKVIMDGLKKAPKGTPPPVAPGPPRAIAPAPPPGAPPRWLVEADDFADDVKWTTAEMDDALVKGATAPKQELLDELIKFEGFDKFGDMKTTEAVAYLNKFKKAHPKYYPAPTAAPGAVVAPPKIAVPLERDLVKVRDLPGSTRPYLAKDPTGKQWVVKDSSGTNIKPGHLRSEATADELYRRLGIATPQGHLVEAPGGPMKVTEFLEGGQTLAEWKAGKPAASIRAIHKEVRKGFVADALFANHDVAGLANDNILIRGGRAFRIDNGGALAYRAQGAPKRTWGAKVVELDTMRDASINPNTAAIFGDITDEEIERQIRHIMANRELLLAGVEDDAVRGVLAARIDDLATRLPQTPVRATVPAPPGRRRAAYGNSPEVPERVRTARSNGVNIAGDREDIEDLNILVWEEVGKGNKPHTKLQFKVTFSGSEKIKAALGDELVAARGVAPAQVANVHPEDTYWNTILKSIKTVNHHAADGKYNSGTLAELANTKKIIELEMKTAVGDKKRMLKYYEGVIKDVEVAQAAKKTTGELTQYFHKPKPVPEPIARRRRRDINVRRDDGIDFRTATFRDGVGKAGNGRNSFRTAEAYTIDMGEDIEVKFIPNDGGFSEAHGRAMHGTVSVTVPEEATEEAINKALGVLEEMGLSTRPPSKAYEEALYLHRGVYINNKHTAPGYKAIWEANIPDEERVVKMKQWIKTNMKIDVDTVPTYDPAGISRHVDGSGYRHWERWDLPAEKIAEEMKDYALVHTTGGLSTSYRGRIPNALDGILESGGEFTSTTGRIRKGVSVGQTGGASYNSDINTGGASYFFTRIRKARGSTKGFFFKIGRLSRQDAVSYSGDRFGRISALRERAATINSYRKYGQMGGNETIFKEGFGLDDLDFIRVHDRAERADVIATFKKHGIETLPDGRAVEDIVVEGSKMCRHRRLR